MDNYLLSVIIPVYKTGGTLYRCLDSIFNQLSHTDSVEVIAVNDASPDNCGELLEIYRRKHPRLRIITHERNLGEAGAHNTGITSCHGEYYTFVDSDDALRSNAIVTFIGIIKDFKPDLVHYAYARVDENGVFKSKSQISYVGLIDIDVATGKMARAVFRDTAFGIMTAGAVYKKSVAPDLRMNPKYPISGERYYGWQFFQRCKKVYLTDEVLYDYYQYANSVSKRFSDAAVEGLLELNKLYWSEFSASRFFKNGGEHAFMRLFPAQVGWDYDLVFKDDLRKIKFKQLYFEALRTFLAGGVSLKVLGVGHFYLKIAAVIKSVFMVGLYRALIVNMLWRGKSKLKRLIKGLIK